MGGRRFLAAIVALGGALAIAAPAQASFHEISIREVYPGSVAQPDSDYVVLQMYFGGQQFVAGHTLTAYGPTGTTSSFTFPSHLPNGASQQTILVGDSGVEAALGVAPDLTNASFALDPAGGAVCWAGSYDCVAWGGFTGSAPGAGLPADPLGIPNGMALRRTIAPGCPTLLEFGDDSNSSSADFADATPQPRNNASAIVEQPCTGPTTTIDTKPANPTKATSASFTFHSTPAGGTFECKLDSAAFAACPDTGIEYAGPLGDGQHTFQVRGKSGGGTLGNTASYGWRVDTVAPSTTIDSHPADPSAGTNAPFTFHASEAGSSFQCSLAEGAAPDSFSACSSGKSYPNLADGEYAFKVRATDTAGNQGAATSFEWTVDNSLADTTPPDTVIDTKPPDPSGSPSATFTYHSTESGSSFECKLDGAAFTSCPAAGVGYSGLANGSHTFQVRATDTSDNVDPTPAGYTFGVAVAPPATVPTTTAPPAATPASPAPTARPRKHRKRPKRCRRAKQRRVAFGHHNADHRPGKRCKKGRSRNRASASDFHLVLLREIYPGSSASPNSEYVELQMYAPGQEFVQGHTVHFFDSAGTDLGSVTFGSDVARGANQSTVLIASAEAESQFGVLADLAMPGGKLDPAGGAVCWEALDCASWGAFSGSPGSPTGNPADPLGIPDGMALRRTIAPGCPTLLELGDDSNQSAADFADAFPAPRPNSVAPSESACGSQGGGPGGGGGPGAGDGRRGVPQTFLRRRPSRRTADRTPTFGFAASRPSAAFQCALDRRRFKGCRSPFTAPRLGLGEHVFRVRARAANGAVDRSPAVWRFEVVRRG